MKFIKTNLIYMLYIIKILLDKTNRSTTLENCLLFIKPQIRSIVVIDHIISILSQHNIKVIERGKVLSCNMKSKSIIQKQYPELYKYSMILHPSIIEFTDIESKLIYKTFNRTWTTIQSSKLIFNDIDTCTYLNEDFDCINNLWNTSLLKIKIRKGLYIACIDESCTTDKRIKSKLKFPIYIINGFYNTMLNNYQYTYKNDIEKIEISTDYFICEFDSNQLTWKQLLKDVIGLYSIESNHLDQQIPSLTSIQGSIMLHWDSLGLLKSPMNQGNCIHVSYSAFESMVDRLRWKKNSMIFTDLLGSKLLNLRIKTLQINQWLDNPLMKDDIPLFTHLHTLNSTECIEYLLNLIEK